MRASAFALLTAILPTVLVGARPAVAQQQTEAPAPATISVELNTLESAEGRCRITFVIDNKTPQPIESLKLDLAVFNGQHVVQRRLLTELGPVRASKTIVKTFAVDGGCNDIGSILVNDVTCAPTQAGNSDACLDHLALSSRVKNVKLFK